MIDGIVTLLHEAFNSPLVLKMRLPTFHFRKILFDDYVIRLLFLKGKL